MPALWATSLPRLRNYNNRSRYMMPEIIASRLTDHHGDVFQVYLRLVEKAILSGVFDLDLRVVYQTEEPGRLAIESRSQSVVEVSDASAPVGSAAKDQGLLWALNNYWRILQMDGGLYVECEALVLSRQTPVLLGWIGRPVIDRSTAVVVWPRMRGYLNTGRERLRLRRRKRRRSRVYLRSG